MKMTVDLFDSIINTSQDCVFWKDRDRRFLGVNQAFLDFYGFDSAEVLIGKTDEDMGWHSAPEPFMQDELRVLSGISTYKVPGKCFIRGEERDIIASKRPLYEGDEIVGLVGSFIDVTDVVRKDRRPDGMQDVYTVEKLRRFTFFDRLLDETGLYEVLDPLTGVVSRVYAMGFVSSLIAAGTPFTFAIIDLDNFKYINDTFGHDAGDTVLKAESVALAEFLGEKGIVGRFGGDELLMINLQDIDYASKKQFFSELYADRSVSRRSISFDDGSTFITCTTGCASYPGDATNYDDLFRLIDKTLYIGKNKGRNCYIIYLEEKHRDLAMNKVARLRISEIMIKLRRHFDSGRTLRERLCAAMDYLSDVFRLTDLYYVDNKNRMFPVFSEAPFVDVTGISDISPEDIYTTNTVSEIESICHPLYEELKEAGIKSLLLVRAVSGNITRGYLICGAKRRFRLWQDNEFALLYFLAGLVAELEDHEV